MNYAHVHSLEEIHVALLESGQHVSDYFASIPEESFFAHPPAVWSPAENLAHLSKSVRAATLGLRVPQSVAGLIWGAAPSRTYTELISEYKSALTGGGQSPPEFVAEMETPAGNLAEAKQAVLDRWQQSAAKLAAAAATWKDEDLDGARIPHPLLGKLTIRELLFFTLYHNQHHINDVRRLLGQPEANA